MGAANTPQKMYKTWLSDSTRWEPYNPRAGDIIIGTAWKCGTTWMQQIISLLVFQSPAPRPISEISPWIDCLFMLSVEDMYHLIEAQSHRRFLKSHLPFDGFPYYEQVRYIHVARDGRYMCMSAFNHDAALTPFSYEQMDGGAEETLGPYPRCPDDPRVFWHDWLTRGVQAGETDGYPDLSFFNLEAIYWQARHTDNLLLVHYNDLQADLEGEMRRIAAFLSIAPPEEMWPQLVEAATFAAMKRDGATLLPMVNVAFEGGSGRFFFKGTNGRWRDVMTAEDLALYDQVAARMTPGLARWIEQGRLGAGDPRVAPE